MADRLEALFQQATMAKKKSKWERDFEAQDVKEQLHQITIVLRREPDKGGEVTRICRLAIQRIRWLESQYDRVFRANQKRIEKESKDSARSAVARTVRRTYKRAHAHYLGSPALGWIIYSDPSPRSKAIGRGSTSGTAWENAALRITGQDWR